MNQKPIFNLEDTDLGMYCIVGIVLVFMAAIVIGGNRIPDWSSLLAFGTAAIGLIATIAVAKLKNKLPESETPAAPTVIAPKKPSPARKRPMPTPKGAGVGT